MKRFWIVLLSLGLIMGFSMSAYALTVDSTGVVWYRAWYIDNPTMQDEAAVPTTPTGKAAANSTAHFDQRFRLGTRAKVADGLDFVFRADWAEDKWAPVANGKGVPAIGGSVNQDITGQEPIIAIDYAMVRFRTVAGTFQVGPQGAPVPNWGTDFNNSGGTKQGILWLYDVPGTALRLGAAYQKEVENAFYQTPWVRTQTDADSDTYSLRFNWDRKKGLDFGAQLVYARDATGRVPDTAAGGGFLTSAYAFEPYVRTKIGPVNIEAEGFYAWGDIAKQDIPVAGTPDVTAEGRGIYVDAKVNMGPAYVGASYIYMSGDDPSTPDKAEGNIAKVFAGGSSLRADRMFFSGSDYYTKQVGTYQIPGNPGGGTRNMQGVGGGTNQIENLKSYGLYGGFSPSKKLSTEISVWMLKVDVAKVTAAPFTDFVSDDIGKEFAATANYKIFDNLAVQVDFAYLWAGDYWKGTNAAALIANNYFVTSWLILDF
jgi:hypothetical protein